MNLCEVIDSYEDCERKPFVYFISRFDRRYYNSAMIPYRSVNTWHLLSHLFKSGFCVSLFYSESEFLRYVLDESSDIDVSNSIVLDYCNGANVTNNLAKRLSSIVDLKYYLIDCF